jgi:biopolymer transport protein ExbD
MAFSANSGSGSGGPMAEINVTPLVDVMLVLLIIFMITAPLMQHKIRIDLPQATLNKNQDEPVEPIDLAVKEDGSIYWNDSPISELELKAQLAVTAQKAPQPELQIRADKTTQYQAIAKVMADAKNQGMVKIGFITTPGPKQQ